MSESTRGGGRLKFVRKFSLRAGSAKESKRSPPLKPPHDLPRVVQRINRIDADNCETLIGYISRGRLSCWVARHPTRHFRLHSRPSMHATRADCELPQMEREHVLQINHRPFIPPNCPYLHFFLCITGGSCALAGRHFGLKVTWSDFAQ